jgi:hypothetical protein
MLRHRPTEGRLAMRPWWSGRAEGSLSGRHSSAHGRFDRLRGRRDAGARLTARRRKRPRGIAGMSLGRGLRGRLGSQSQSKGSRKGLALVGLMAALTGAGAAVLKRRWSMADVQAPGYFPPPEPVGEAPPETDPAPQARSG